MFLSLFGLRCPHSLDDAENYWDMLGSDAAAAVFSQADQEEIGKTVEDLKAQHSMAQPCQERIFNKAKSLNKGAGKRKFIGSKAPFPPLSAGMTIEALLQTLPEGTKLECDKFNGRWKAGWLTPHTRVWKTISRSWGCRGHAACLSDIQLWAWSLASGYGLECPFHKPDEPSASTGSSTGTQPPKASPSQAPGPAASSAKAAPGKRHKAKTA